MSANDTSTSDTKTLLELSQGATDSDEENTSEEKVKEDAEVTVENISEDKDVTLDMGNVDAKAPDIKLSCEECSVTENGNGDSNEPMKSNDDDVRSKNRHEEPDEPIIIGKSHDVSENRVEEGHHAEELTNEKTALLEEGGAKDDVAMTTEDERIEDMTRSVMALNTCMDLGPDDSTRVRGFKRYHRALKLARPIRLDKAPEEEVPVSNAGCLSMITFSWQSSMMWNIYRKGVQCIANLKVGVTEQAKPNIDRLERIWLRNIKTHGVRDASFFRVTFDFIRTRFIMTTVSYFFGAMVQPAGAFVLYYLLRYLNSGDVQLSVGIGLVALLTVGELCRSATFSMSWFFSYTTGARVRSAVMGLLYRKVLRLRSLEDKSVGELVNLMNNDVQRIYEAVLLAPLMIPGPLVFLAGLIYMSVLIGPWSLLAMGIYMSFYPFMVLISKLTNYYRRKCVVITDKRVRLMNELLTCIKLIKMYAWEKSFAKTISDIRSQERKVLEKGAYVQSISSGIAPVVPIFSSVFTFLAYVLSGNDLTPVVAFTIIAVLNSMRLSLAVLPFSVKAIADAQVSFKRYKKILLMDEMAPHKWEVFNEKYSLVLHKATFRWDKGGAGKPDTNGKTKEDKIKKMEKKSAKGSEEMQDLKSAEHTNGDVTFVDTPTLQNISVNVEKGKLVGICGSVGCGKSSLLSAVLGRMFYVSGKIASNGSTAYVTQQAWIMNTTVRDNILFGEEFDPVKYESVVQACNLLEDFEDLVDGDQTEIGERGINLSGGQKQRISLARAVYSDKDIYLLDDPLSAVDIHIGRHIFSECILKELKGKTVLFVTHQLQYLSKCDRVLFMKNGTITDSGTHAQLMAGDTEYAALIKVFYTKEKEKQASVDSLGEHPRAPRSPIHKQFSMDRPDFKRQRTISRGISVDSHGGSPRLRRDPLRQFSVMSESDASGEEEDEDAPKSGKLIVAEEKKEGKIGWPVYKGYMQAAGGLVVSLLVMFVFFIAIASQAFTNWWLSYWLNQGSGNTTITKDNVTMISNSISDHPNMRFYAMVYGASVAVIVVLTVFRAFIFMKATLHASSNLHNGIFQKMLQSPMSFFDTTPVGRIINRFSADLDEIDVRLPITSEMFVQNFYLILFSILIIAYVSPWFLIALVPLAIGFVFLNIIFTSGVRELMRMNSITRSPVISHVTASVQGISTIHAYGKTNQFMNNFCQLLDKNTCYFYMFYCSNRWLAFRLDLMSTCIVGVTGLCVVLTYQSLTPALAGLALSFANQMSGLFQFTIRQAIETEAKFVAVQRLQHYSEDTETEGPTIVKDKRPPAGWPQKGEIKFDRYKMRYRDNLPLALKGLKFEIKEKEKVGIVGRSGSGKSSLGVGLFRLVEPAFGTIFIDNIDITTIGLEDLRSRLAIIPQDPVLFIGTVRYNLDPFSQHNDEAIWGALEKCHVKDTISALELKLDHLVIENGENFSVGERQLICMARAVLRNSKILMLDEATAAIDTETDALVQKTIKEAFHDCTMLIIAHRLNTVLGCDRILVMEDGMVVEFGRPKDLMASNSSKFKGMLDAVEKQQETLDS